MLVLSLNAVIDLNTVSVPDRVLATTALAMSAGYAAADVALSGDARMGIKYDSAGVDNLEFTSRARVTFTLSGETDGGLAFGAKFRADNAAANPVTTVVDDANDVAPGGVNYIPTLSTTNTGGAVNGMAGSVFISGEFGKLSMGDVDSASKAIVGQIDGVGLTGLGDLNEISYIGNNNAPGALYEYSIDGFSFAAGVGQIGSIGGPAITNRVLSIGAGYSFDGFSIGIGYEDEDGGPSQVSVSAAYTMDMVTVKAIYADHSGNGDSYGLSVSGSFDATTVTAFAARDTAGDTNAGLGASYDLGGGASLVGGIARDGGASATVADFGLSFKF